MKGTSKIIAGLVMVWLVATVIGRGQETASQNSLSSINLTSAAVLAKPLSMSAADVASLQFLSDEQLTNFVNALDATPTIPFDALLTNEMVGNFYSLQHPEWPPLPGDTSHSPVWQMSDFDLLSDLDFNYNAASTQSLVARPQMRTMDITGSPSPGGGDDGDGTNSYSYGSSYTIPDYGTNLWIARVGISSNYLTGIVSNTQADVEYEIQSLTDLTQPNWVSQGFILGSETTNWTSLNALAVSLTNNFFIRVRSWISSDGSGLPDWWELQYFGHIGVDPDAADPGGDGLTIWEDFVTGANPTSFNNPSTMYGATATLNTNTGAATITWPSANGAVIGYTIYRFDHLTNGLGGSYTVVTFNVGLTNELIDPEMPGFSEADFQYVPPSNYEVYANYANGSTFEIANVSPYSSAALPTVEEVPGASNATELIVTHIPVGVSSIELERSDLFFVNPAQSGIPATNLLTPSAFAIYSVSDFTNAIFTVPTNMLYTATCGSYFHLQMIWPDGSKSAPVLAGSPEVPFYDGRIQIAQNISFLLGAASLTNAFFYSLESDATGYQVEQPTNYVYAGLYDAYSDNYATYSGLGDANLADWQRPFIDNFVYRNFIYGDTTNLDISSGFLNTGCTLNADGSFTLNVTSDFQFNAPTNGTLIPALDQSVYSPPTTDIQRLGMSINGNGLVSLPANIFNYFGLQLSSVLVAHNDGGTLFLDSISAGRTFQTTNASYCFYPEYAPPRMSAVGYYFGRIASPKYTDTGFYDTMPGNIGFTNGMVQPFIVVGMDGLPKQFAAFAIKSTPDNLSSLRIYEAQYFDKAYVVDSSGNVTSTQTGVLSPGGSFFPTQAGPVALVTMPDINTGQRGTNIIYVIGLNVDANHDGIMDTSYFGPDQVSDPNGPSFNFWINDGYIAPGQNGSRDQDVPIYPGQTSYASTSVQPNYLYGQIRCQRNLENFARLSVLGVPQFPSGQGYSVCFGFSTSYSAGINLYQAWDSTDQYLTDTNYASEQISVYNNMLGQVGGYYGENLQDVSLPSGPSGAWIQNFLFEGSSVGSGTLTLTVFQNNNVVAQAAMNINIDDVKNYYEQAEVTNVVQTWPEMVQTTNLSGFEVTGGSQYFSPNDAKQQAVFVHGWKMSEADYEDFSDLMYKRLYWQGFQGRFASLRWPTRSTDTDTNIVLDGAPSADFTYNRSEHIAFESARGAAAYFNNLRSRDTNFTISVCSHSMGGIVVMEALKELAASNQAPLDNYVVMQGALPAACYDTTVTNVPLFSAVETVVPTPDIYSDYAQGITNALRNGGKIINFYNPLDFALTVWVLNQGFYLNSSLGPLTMKPNTFFGYSYDPTTSTALVTTNSFQFSFGVTNVETRIVTDPFELMPFVSRPRSIALGAQSGVGNGINGGEYNLQSQLNFTDAQFDHSGEFNRNIQEPQIFPFYTQLLNGLFQGQP